MMIPFIPGLAKIGFTFGPLINLLGAVREINPLPDKSSVRKKVVVIISVRQIP